MGVFSEASIGFNAEIKTQRSFMSTFICVAARVALVYFHFAMKRCVWLLVVCIFLSGCCNVREGQIVMRDGEAYIFEKALTREQIQDGNEIREMQNQVEKRADFIRRTTYP